tara:strand:- start:93259 stop:93594 length:336 start_codon:yes stop_codon:yes gene_type:complete
MIYFIVTVSSVLNLLLLWYVVKVLQKFIFISENLSDLYLLFRSYSVFLKSLYGMNSYHGEPMIEELMHRTKSITEEIEIFREVFEYTLDIELEEELNDIEEEDNPRPIEAT